MATRSMIGRCYGNGVIKAIYCHWDGHPDTRMPILQEVYDNMHKVNKLLEEGDISILSSVSQGGNELLNSPAIIYKRYADYLQACEDLDCEYSYLFDGFIWRFAKVGRLCW